MNIVKRLLLLAILIITPPILSNQNKNDFIHTKGSFKFTGPIRYFQASYLIEKFPLKNNNFICVSYGGQSHFSGPTKSDIIDIKNCRVIHKAEITLSSPGMDAVSDNKFLVITDDRRNRKQLIKNTDKEPVVLLKNCKQIIFSKDEKFFLYSNENQVAKLVKSDDQKVIKTFNNFYYAKFIHGTPYVFIKFSNSNAILFDYTRNKSIRKMEDISHYQFAAYQGYLLRFLIIRFKDNTVHIIDTSKNKIIGEYKNAKIVYTKPPGFLVLEIGNNLYEIIFFPKLYSMKIRNLNNVIPIKKYPRTIMIKFILVQLKDGSHALLNMEKNKVLEHFHNLDTIRTKFSNSGNFLYVRFKDYSIPTKIVNLNKNKVIISSKNLFYYEFSPNEKFLFIRSLTSNKYPTKDKRIVIDLENNKKTILKSNNIASPLCSSGIKECFIDDYKLLTKRIENPKLFGGWEKHIITLTDIRTNTKLMEFERKLRKKRYCNYQSNPCRYVMPNEKYLIVPYYRGEEATIIDLENNKIITNLKSHGYWTLFSREQFSHNGESMLFKDEDYPYQIYLLDFVSNKKVLLDNSPDIQNFCFLNNTQILLQSCNKLKILEVDFNRLRSE